MPYRTVATALSSTTSRRAIPIVQPTVFAVMIVAAGLLTGGGLSSSDRIPPLGCEGSVVTADEQLFAVGDGEEEPAGDRSDELDFRESLLVGI